MNPNKPCVITVCDPKYIWGGDHPITLDFIPNIQEEFMWWRGECREVRDIHYTTNGKQIELY